MSHAYPNDLASFVCSKVEGFEESALALLFSVAFQASLLREEERPITFRVLLAEPAELSPDGGIPRGVHRVLFDDPRPFTEQELRRLAPAAKLQRSLIGVRLRADGSPVIWGLVHTGPGWLRVMQGGRTSYVATDALHVISVTGPGRVLVSRGGITLAKLANGRLSGAPIDVFDSLWLPDVFADARAAVLADHRAARARAEVPWADVSPAFPGYLAQQVLRRVLALVRAARHGGTLLFVPPVVVSDICSPRRYVSLKYRFLSEEPRSRLASLLVAATNALAQSHASSLEPVGAVAYQRTTDRGVAAADEAIFELAHFIAGLADVDGAVLITHLFDVVGFGGEIAGDLPDVKRVFRALDLEGEHLDEEPTDSVGTRHRSVYRLVGAFPETLGAVVSQDGGIRFVRHHGGRVITWDQVGTSSLEL